MARYIGINTAFHDGGISVFDDDGNLLLFSQYERISRRKTDHEVGDISQQLVQAGLPPLQKTDRLFFTNPRMFGEFMAKMSYAEKNDKNAFLLPLSEIFKTFECYFVDHHLSHAAASWMFRSPDTTSSHLYLVFDGSGIKTNLLGGFYSIGEIGPGGIKEFESRRLDGRRFSSSARLDRLLFPGSRLGGIAGKLMGMAGHFLEAQATSFHQIDIESLNNRFTLLGGVFDRQLMVDYASVYQTYLKEISLELRVILDRYPHPNVVVGGGTFLALELNTLIVEKGRKLLFGPPVNDTGISLGSAALGFQLITGRWPKPLSDPFLQWQPPEDRSGSSTSIKEVADRLVRHNRPVGVVIGKAEAGPRALGHRSLLACPTLENKKLVSEVIKKREFYRPVAPIVTAADFDKFFLGPKGKYMQFRNDCLPSAADVIPGVVHTDNSARAQVLEYDDNPVLYELLVEVGKLTGSECLINTSLNGPGKPIVNTLADAEKEMDCSLFDLVCLG
jgi:carbamoyltransferase